MPSKRRRRSSESATLQEIELPPTPTRPLPIIKVVGISGSGKSTLVAALRDLGYDARPVSQEHSQVPTLWQQFERTTYLFYLYASLEVQQRRRQDVTWTAAAHEEEMLRLSQAREHADLRINTDLLSSKQVLGVVLSFLTRWRVRRAESALTPVQATGSSFRAD
jgi:RNase adaptor protein for sRNA GlmZ degradation